MAGGDGCGGSAAGGVKDGLAKGSMNGIVGGVSTHPGRAAVVC